MPLDFPNSPSNGATFASGGITWQYDGEKWNILAGGGPTYRTAAQGIPTSPVDGEEIYYEADAGNVIVWHLRYNASRSRTGGTGAWEFLGGASLVSGPSGSIDTTSTGFVAITSGPTMTIPVRGNYEVTFGAESQLLGASGTDADVGLHVGNTLATSARVTVQPPNQGSSNTQTNVLTLATSDSLTVRGKSTTGQNTRFRMAYIVARPRFIY